MCRLKTKAGKLWNRAQILESRKCECSKLIFQILVYYYYYYKLFCTGISMVLNCKPFFKQASKQMVFDL